LRSRRRLPLEQLSPYLFPDAERGSLPPAVAWPLVFGNDNPVEIEVGFGKGLFLLTSACAQPGINFFGIEILRKYQLHTATRLAIRQAPNVRLACADARVFLRDRVPPGSIQAVHVYFPDPWWKTRHHKRRLFTAEFAGLVGRALRPGGRFLIATDVEEYFRVITAIMADQRCFKPASVASPGEPRCDLDYLTNFERKFRQQGRAIYRAVFTKVEFAETIQEK